MSGEAGGGPADADPPVRAGLLLRQPVQHFAPGFRLLAADPRLRLRVYYWHAAVDGLYDRNFGRHVRWNTDLHSGYDWWTPPAEPAAARRGLALWQRLREDRPEVLLSFGWASQVARTGIGYATVTGTPVLYYGDTNGRAPALGRYPRLRRRALRWLFARAAGALTTGAFNREFYLAHGVPAYRLHPGVYPVDTEAFEAAGRRRGPADPGRPVVIGFAGKLIPVKAPMDLIAAVADLPREPAWRLRLIGDGPLRASLAAAVRARGLADRVEFLGFRNTDELPELMAGVDIMVMPSRLEPRGLVPIEAMAAGAVAVVSSATGVWGPGDAVQDGQTGLVYPAGDVGALAARLRRLLAEPRLRDRLAAAGQERARAYGVRQFALTAAAALTAAVAVTGPPAPAGGRREPVPPTPPRAREVPDVASG